MTKRNEVLRDTPEPTTLVSGMNGNNILLDALNSGLAGPLPEFDKCSDGGPSVSGRSGTTALGSGGGHVVQALMDRLGKLEEMLGQARIGEGQARVEERDFMKDKGKSKDRPMLLEKENGTLNEHVMATKAGDLRGHLSKTRFFGHSHWMHAFAQARKVMCFEVSVNGCDDVKLKLKSHSADVELKGLINECKAMARVIKASQAPQWSLWGTNSQHSMPDRGLADQLVENYLRTHESIHRILHIPSFRKEYSQYWESPQNFPMVSLMKLILVMAIGVSFYQGPDFLARRTQAIQWLYTAKSWLTSPNGKGRLHIACIQVECLLLIARSIFNIDADIIWNSAGALVRTAMSIGLHRDPKNFNRHSVLQREIRRRLWATILELNLQTCLNSGMPPMISLQDYDTEPPANINDDQISESTLEPPISKPRDVFTQTSVQLTLVDSLPTQLEAARMVNGFRFDPSYDDIIRLGQRILQTYKENYTFLSRAMAVDDPAVVKPTPFHRKLLDLKTQRFLLALHRPFAMRARTDPRYYYSHKIYLDTAMAVLQFPTPVHSKTPGSTPDTSTSSPYSSYQEPLESDFQRYISVHGGYLKEILIHSVIIIYLEMLLPLEEDPSVAFSLSQKPSREPYHRLLKEMADLSLKRIELGETTVKAYLMYAIATGHIDALEAGMGSEEAIARSGRNAVLRCRDILRGRMEGVQREKELRESMQFGAEAMSFNHVPAWPGVDMDFAMQDWQGIDFEAPTDGWLFSGLIDQEML